MYISRRVELDNKDKQNAQDATGGEKGSAENISRGWGMRRRMCSFNQGRASPRGNE